MLVMATSPRQPSAGPRVILDGSGRPVGTVHPHPTRRIGAGEQAVVDPDGHLVARFTNRRRALSVSYTWRVDGGDGEPLGTIRRPFLRRAFHLEAGGELLARAVPEGEGAPLEHRMVVEDPAGGVSARATTRHIRAVEPGRPAVEVAYDAPLDARLRLLVLGVALGPMLQDLGGGDSSWTSAVSS